MKKINAPHTRCFTNNYLSAKQGLFKVFYLPLLGWTHPALQNFPWRKDSWGPEWPQDLQLAISMLELCSGLGSNLLEQAVCIGTSVTLSDWFNGLDASDEEVLMEGVTCGQAGSSPLSLGSGSVTISSIPNSVIWNLKTKQTKTYTHSKHYKCL